MAILGTEELRDQNLWKALGAEFLGTAFLVFIGCGSTTGGRSFTPTYVEIAFCFGLMVAIMVQTIAHISGGHINPAVTAAMMITGRCKVVRGALYIAMQFLGAVIGASFLAAVLPGDMRSSLGQTKVNPELSEGQGMGIELFITFVLVFTVFSVVDPKRVDNKGSGPLIIGLSVTACHLWAIKYTGSSMNPARTFGPAVVGNRWDNHWVYWVGPILGGILAGLMYRSLFSAKDERHPADH